MTDDATTEAKRLVAEGYSLSDEGQNDAAAANYRRAIELAPEWSVPHYNLGLHHKYRGEWEQSLAFNQRAAELAPDDEAAWWNLGIAATALGRWDEARRAWRAYGIEIADGDGPPECRWGMTPIRLDPNDEAEVVWAQRLDPARARIVSVPLPTSPHNFGAVVLHDGAPNGHRIVDGRKYSVFDELEVLERSPLRKYVLELASSDDDAAQALARCAEAVGGAAEDWGSTTNVLCAKCSRGEPHEHAGASSVPAHPHCGLAARDDAQAQAIIEAWLDTNPKADLVRWYEAG